MDITKQRIYKITEFTNYQFHKKKSISEIVGLNEFGQNHMKLLWDLEDYVNRKQVFLCCFTCVLGILSVLKLI